MSDADPDPHELVFVTLPTNESDAGWLTTAASQIFLMQLGFVETHWAKSIIIKNLEAAIIGSLAFLFLGYTLSGSDESAFGTGFLGTFDHAFLINVSPAEYEYVFIATTYATTACTIISGSVLERMKNYVYCIWCFLTIFLPYSIVAYWVWNPNGWLWTLGFADCAGSAVVHGTGGIASLIAMSCLGPRMHSEKARKNGKTVKLKAIPSAERPVLVLIGSLILWYGWFAFNVTSPFTVEVRVGAYLGSAGINTLIAPCTAAISSMLYMSYTREIKYEDLVGCILSGAVAITAGCYTVEWWASVITGFLSSFVYFGSIWLVRKKMVIDDPLCVTSVRMYQPCIYLFVCLFVVLLLYIHTYKRHCIYYKLIYPDLFNGYFGCIAEGIFAAGHVGESGLVFGNYRHFFIQIGGVLAICVFQFIVGYLLWYLILDRILVNRCNKTRMESIRVLSLDTYLGTPVWEIDINMAFRDILKCENNAAKTFLLELHCQCLHVHEDDEKLEVAIEEEVKQQDQALMDDDQTPDNRLYANALDFILIVLDHDYDTRLVKQQLFQRYIAKKGSRCIGIFEDELIEATKKLCDSDDVHCFNDAFLQCFEFVKSFTAELLPHLNIPRQEYTHKIPYRIDKSEWTVQWIRNRRTTNIHGDNNVQGSPSQASQHVEGKSDEGIEMDMLDLYRGTSVFHR